VIGQASAGSEETLRDGTVVTVRPLCAEDSTGAERFWRRLDASERRRFVDLARLAPDQPGTIAIPRAGKTSGMVALAQVGSRQRVVGLAHYQRTSEDAASFLVFVDPSCRRVGLGTVLLRDLAAAARHAGVRRLVSDVPRDDVAVLNLIAELGLDYEEQPRTASVRASFSVQETDAYLDAVLADQRVAARFALEPFLHPSSIAVVGASDEPSSIGGLVFANLVRSGFAGPLYPVNPHRHLVHDVQAFDELASCPDPPDLVLVAVPAPLVAGIVDQASKLGCRAVCVISAGFAEAGEDGRNLQDELRRRARTGAVRLIGPNCMGLLNGGPDPRFNATFSTTFPPPGHMAFVSQSGGLGLAALALLAGPSSGAHADQRNAVVVSTGRLDWDRPDTWTGAIDRSPCGTGTCAKMATLHARGMLPLERDFRHEGILGTVFTGRLLGETMVGGRPAVIPTISGRAFVTGHSRYVLEADDPFPEGFTVGDIWSGPGLARS